MRAPGKTQAKLGVVNAVGQRGVETARRADVRPGGLGHTRATMKREDEGWRCGGREVSVVSGEQRRGGHVETVRVCVERTRNWGKRQSWGATGGHAASLPWVKRPFLPPWPTSPFPRPSHRSSSLTCAPMPTVSRLSEQALAQEDSFFHFLFQVSVVCLR